MSILLTAVCLCHQAVQFGTGQRSVTLCGWEGKHRSAIVLTMCHKLSDIHLQANGQRKGNEHPAYAPVKGLSHSLALPLIGRTILPANVIRAATYTRHDMNSLVAVTDSTSVMRLLTTSDNAVNLGSRSCAHRQTSWIMHRT